MVERKIHAVSWAGTLFASLGALGALQDLIPRRGETGAIGMPLRAQEAGRRMRNPDRPCAA
jgi:hypothetical protein